MRKLGFHPDEPEVLAANLVERLLVLSRASAPNPKF
jgi:hypothetical protein